MLLAVNSPRRFPAWGAAVLGLLVLTGCPKREPVHPPPPVNQDRALALAGRPPGANLSTDHDGALYYDLRYLDSTTLKPESSWSARSQREMAIALQLMRLDLSKHPFKHPSTEPVTRPSEDSMAEKSGDAPLKKFASEDTWRADIYRKIDSLKVLEHLPVTPH